MPADPPPVIDLDAKRMQRGETMFFGCPCEAEHDRDFDPGWFVVTALAGGRPVITGLVCTECGRTSDVSNGFMTAPEKRNG